MNEPVGSERLAADLKQWAAGRRGPGEPPTAAEMVALRDGVLKESDAERVREWIAIDPEWAEVWRDLSDLSSWTDETPAAEIDSAWNDLASRLAADQPASLPMPRNPAATRRRWTRQPAWAMAALLVLALGGWFVLGPSTTIDDEHWRRFDLSADTQRAGAELTLSPSHDGVIFVAPQAAAGDGKRIEVVVNATGIVVSTRSLAGSDEPAIRVSREGLVDGGVVVIRVLNADGSERYRRAVRVVFGI